MRGGIIRDMQLISDLQSDQMKDLCRDHRVRGDNKKNSDVDLLVEFNRPMSLFGLGRLMGSLEDRLEKSVDLTLRKAENNLTRI